jgi:hypothetical protein
MLEDLQVVFLTNDSAVLHSEKFAKIRIPLGVFESLEKDERMRLIASEYERSEITGRRHGSERCEAALEPLGLSGPVEPDIKKDFHEIHHIRNVLVHRGGIADRRIVEGCPWLCLKSGDRIAVSHEMQRRYNMAVVNYTMTIVSRIARRFGAVLKRTDDDWVWSD